MRHRERYVVPGGVAVISGAAGGIGSALATNLAGRGSHLALTDQEGTGLPELVDNLREAFPGQRITGYERNLQDREVPPWLMDQVLMDHGHLTLLINNAGVALGGRFEQVTMDDVDWLMDINLRAIMALTSAALPHLHAGSQVTNISSLFGLIAPVGNAPYAASKFGVRGFSQALRVELRPRGIGVTTVFPGGIRTQIAARARRGARVSDDEWRDGQELFTKMLTIDPSRAAGRIVQGTIDRRARVLIGSDAYVGDLLGRIAPAKSTDILESLIRFKARW